MEELLDMAWRAYDLAYCPYSKFQVGAAVETIMGERFSGCNVEVANYGCTVCAERTAMVKAVSEGSLKRGGLRHVVVAADTPKPVGPCGSCRQMIEEFANEDTLVHLSNQKGKIAHSFKHRELLPYSFGPENLL
ncbi:MAG: cytidine deaminase [Acidobacteriota bacterium]|nr:cytidine deaminase [Acidobacteriota bacterium]